MPRATVTAGRFKTSGTDVAARGRMIVHVPGPSSPPTSLERQHHNILIGNFEVVILFTLIVANILNRGLASRPLSHKNVLWTAEHGALSPCALAKP